MSATPAGTKAPAAPKAEKDKASVKPTTYRIIELVSGTVEEPKEVKIHEGTVTSSNGAPAARKKAYDALSDEDQDKGWTIAAIPVRSLVFKKRGSKIRRVSTEE